MTLYMFDPDAAGTPTCYDDCATNWPACSRTAPRPPGRPRRGQLTTVDRTDGGKQVKFGTWPLYYFAADAAAGDTNGQGVGGVWWVVGADGDAIKAS